MTESATTSNLLPTDFVGTTMAGVQNEDGKFRIYFQNKDYQICEMSLNDPNSTSHTILKLTTATIPTARINTPIAALSWDNLRQIRVYYITMNSHIQEISYTQGVGWHKDSDLGIAIDNSNCLYAQRQSKEPFVRVGFQSSTAPQTITEACYYQGGWKNRML
ncbi:hypothetical protein F4604DRAFT_580278 [Suillus subluteus]|nr:hypothetical protein F4604DRAFT_580278 [Suillus subluteus]